MKTTSALVPIAVGGALSLGALGASIYEHGEAVDQIWATRPAECQGLLEAQREADISEPAYRNYWQSGCPVTRAEIAPTEAAKREAQLDGLAMAFMIGTISVTMYGVKKGYFSLPTPDLPPQAEPNPGY